MIDTIIIMLAYIILQNSTSTPHSLLQGMYYWQSLCATTTKSRATDTLDYTELYNIVLGYGGWPLLDQTTVIKANGNYVLGRLLGTLVRFVFTWNLT